MYSTLLPLHSILRWLLVAGLAYSIARSVIGLVAKRPYSRLDSTVRSVTSAVSHVQLIIGFVLYFKSPIVSYFRANGSVSLRYMDIAFFGVYHISLMLIAILMITIGAAKAKRANSDYDKHRQIFWWFGTAVVLILMAIPWPFSPYVARPYLRIF